jgi:dolichol-phosphate mannosyltransferase
MARLFAARVGAPADGSRAAELAGAPGAKRPICSHCMTSPLASFAVASLAIAQAFVLLVIVGRLLPGRHRPPPVLPSDESATGERGGRVSVVVPVRNEAERIGHCLDGLRAQGPTMIEAVIVDGRSTDATREIVQLAASVDARIRLLDEPARPEGMVGRPWAIAAGARAARGQWVLIVDADVMPKRGMVAGALAAAEAKGYDVVSFSPTIVAPGPGARWLQASFVISLVYRFGATGAEVTRPERAVANGQCQLIRRETLERAGGYELAAASYCDDIQIVRALGAAGARVGFLDGRKLFDVLMYPTARATWRAWPRSLNMRDATTPRWRVLDALLLLLGQGLPIPLLIATAVWVIAQHAFRSGPVEILLAANAPLLVIRVLILAAIAPSFAPRGLWFWLSPLADPGTALRVVATMFTPSREWRGSRTATAATVRQEPSPT